jgi:chemotaxis protein CheC
MTPVTQIIDLKTKNLMHVLAKEGVRNSVQGLSSMIGEEMTMSEPLVTLIPVLDLPTLLGPETEAVGVYLTTHGELAGQFLLIFPFEQALEMVDLLMMEPIGTTQELDSMGRSALAEAGNLTGAFFLNKVAEITGLSTLPSAPSVLVDMVGAILNVLVAVTAELADQVMMIRTEIIHKEKHVQANFWFIPNPQTVISFTEKALKILGQD